MEKIRASMRGAMRAAARRRKRGGECRNIDNQKVMAIAVRAPMCIRLRVSAKVQGCGGNGAATGLDRQMQQGNGPNKKTTSVCKLI